MQEGKCQERKRQGHRR